MRAHKLCAYPTCTNVQPCPDHGRKAWSGTARDDGQRISGGRRQQRAHFILNRDDTICHVCGRPGADQADHIIPLAHGGADTVENMAAIHSDPCHRAKTQREGHAGREKGSGHG